MSKETEAVKQGIEKAVANFCELSQMEASRNNAWKIVRCASRRILSDLQNLLQPK